jgi:uncharacterized membrane protein YvbJ
MPYCHECGSEIVESQSYCKECGTETAFNKNSQSNDTVEDTPSRENYGFIFAIADNWERHRVLRDLIDIGLVIASAGIWLGVMLAESLHIYRELNKGDLKPFDEERDERVWTAYQV